MIELFESQGKKLFEEVGCSFQGIVDCLESKFGAVFLPRSLVKTLKVQAPGGSIASEGRRNSMGANSSRDIEAEIRRAAPYNSEVLKHSRNYEPIATNELNDRFDASPAIAGQQIFLRGTNHLYCVQRQTAGK